MGLRPALATQGLAPAVGSALLRFVAGAARERNKARVSSRRISFLPNRGNRNNSEDYRDRDIDEGIFADQVKWAPASLSHWSRNPLKPFEKITFLDRSWAAWAQ